ncbi:MAG: hypothetical protein GTN89_15025 [Acidobacteria bacterium]|nr:hypothetical protein [Acidobacteriota bacterium]NIM63336.1 hypothetical protein [Acidobacteriota bacterium]NIO60520.1 hypothetical protein [Acidobacteriota bacterium]NIQ31640.1 hypothetical protein [Acidobacteriota bacterium]NIQ87127.1 hypothetical protein [Acidobacteriota bacterium]
MFVLLAVVLLVCGAACAAPPEEAPSAPRPYRRPVVAGTIDIPGLVELSGLAASRVRDDTLWAHNDSLNEPLLFAFDGNGKSLGSVRVEGVSFLDWEDMASFELDGVPYLVIGDVGDNRGLRPFVSLWFVREPAIPDADERQASVAAEWELHFRYEDGPRDCEALAVDEIGKRILLLSKRTDPPVLYELPLAREEGELEVRVARRIRTVSHIGKPTGLDVSPDGSRAVVQTSRRTYVFDRQPGQAWPEVFLAPAQSIEIPKLSSIEAVTFDRKGHSLFVTREGRPSPLVRIDPQR